MTAEEQAPKPSLIKRAHDYLYTSKEALGYEKLCVLTGELILLADYIIERDIRSPVMIGGYAIWGVATSIGVPNESYQKALLRSNRANSDSSGQQGPDVVE